MADVLKNLINNIKKNNSGIINHAVSDIEYCLYKH